MSRTTLRRALPFLVLLGLIAGLMAVAGMAVAKPGNGNSSNAKLCKDWESLYRSDGTPFTNRDECVSYGAMGGVILTEPPLPPLPNLVVVDPPSATAGTYEASGAEFGPALTVAGISGSLVQVFGIPGAEGCSAADFFGFPGGAIAVISRGTCSYEEKVLNAQNAGAAAVIVVNNVAGRPPTMPSVGLGPVTIPAVMVSQGDGAVISFGLPATGTVKAKP